MDIERFRQLADAYGASRERWPEEAQALYQRFASTPEGARILAQSASLDAFLDGFTPRAADPLRPARMVRAARRPRRRALAWIAMAYAASAVLGFTLGFTALASDEDELLYSGLLYGSSSIEEFL